MLSKINDDQEQFCIYPTIVDSQVKQLFVFNYGSNNPCIVNLEWTTFVNLICIYRNFIIISYGCQNRDFASGRKGIAKSKIVKSQSKLKDSTKMT